MRSPTDKIGEERDFDCNDADSGTAPLSAKRRDGFTGLLDMVKNFANDLIS